MSHRVEDQKLFRRIFAGIHSGDVKTKLNKQGRLTELRLTGCGLKTLPQELALFDALRVLDLADNNLRSWPPEIFKLRKLRDLSLASNDLTDIPSEISQLTNLRRLDLGLSDSNNYLDDDVAVKVNNIKLVPREISALAQLQILNLTFNQIETLPAEIGRLVSLTGLFLGHNQLLHLPPEIGQISRLVGLYLHNNQLTYLPDEISNLEELNHLVLARNNLKRIPLGIGRLTKLERLDLDDNFELLTPPPEIVTQGQKSILSFLGELQQDCVTRFEAKMLLVGEGGTGKSSLLRQLRGDVSETPLSTTHGIEVDRYTFPHHSHPEVEITLNSWDFGGQEIYHATHQFFLTKRSLYLVVWNARLGAEQGRLNYWLDTIKALAPDAPVLLVATHIDERVPDINYALYQSAFPQLIGNLSVSNVTGAGIEELKSAIATAAADLPLMQQPWPGRWVKTEKALLALPQHHISSPEYIDCCRQHGVDAMLAQGTLGEWLHDLGKILYFRDDFVLSNLIVLKPNWVTKAISQVLTHEKTAVAKGILTHSDLPEIWSKDADGAQYDPYLYPIFLRLMERFDLSYQIEADTPGDHPTRSLVPQLLPHQPPITLFSWANVPQSSDALLEMTYRLAFVPAGIMSWFIVRTHPYTRNLHWREGVLLEYQKHYARVELNPMLREIRFQVSGIQPHNFFTILKNTLDLILARFEGLSVARLIPCICHWKRGGQPVPCARFYRYEDLIKRMQAGKATIECPDSFSRVSVATLLYGIHRSTDERVMEDILRGQQELGRKLEKLDKIDLILEKLAQQSELIARNFTRQWNLEMQKLDVECPNTFWLAEMEGNSFNPKNWVSRKYKLYLLCQHPQGPHTVGDGYILREPEIWWKRVAPWLNQLVRFLKFGVPLGKALGAVHDEDMMKEMETRVELLDQITQTIPSLPAGDGVESLEDVPLAEDQFATGAALRSLHTYLDQVDPNHVWAGLARAITPDGNILWLCNFHRKLFEAKPLVLAPGASI